MLLYILDIVMCFIYVVMSFVYCDVFCVLRCVVCIVINVVIAHCVSCEWWDVCGTDA